jgi:hypothetical protein
MVTKELELHCLGSPEKQNKHSMCVCVCVCVCGVGGSRENMRIILKNKEIYFDINRDSPVFVTSVNMSFSFNLFDSLCLSFFFFL